MFTIEVKPNVLVVTISGFLKMDEATAYLKEFKAKLAGINPRNYHFIIDGKEQKAVAGDVQDLLSEALTLYVNTPFKSHHTVVFNSVVSKSQVKRTGSTEFADKSQFHNSVDDALRFCK